MPDEFGPFDDQNYAQGRWFRDRGWVEPSGVVGVAAANAAAGDLGLTTNGLTSSLGLGRAHVRGAGYERTGAAWTYTHPTNTNVNPRIDRVVLRRDLAAKTVTPAVIQGTPAVSPSAPALTRVEDGAWDLPLHRVTVPANSGTVLSVFDERAWIDPDTGALVAPWVPWSPNWTAIEGAPGLGNGTLIGRYRKVNRHCDLDLLLTFGSTTGGGRGLWRFSLPFAAAAGRGVQHLTVKSYSAAGDMIGFAFVDQGGSTLFPYLPVNNTRSDLAAVRNADTSGAAGTGIPAVAGVYSFGQGHNFAVFGRYETAA